MSTAVCMLVAVLSAAAEPSPQQTLSLIEATRVAMARNPEVAEAASAERPAEHAARGAGALPEPMLSYQAWRQPLSHPFDPTATNMHMIGIRQSLPFPGQLGIAGRAARIEVDARPTTTSRRAASPCRRRSRTPTSLGGERARSCASTSSR